MKIINVNLDQLLYTEPVKTPVTDYDEEGGFFKKMFKKKEEAPEVPFFNTRVEEFGRDDLFEDLNEGYDAYIVKGAPFETMVVVSKCYLILPGKEIFPLYTVDQFAIKNERYGNRPYEQYALDRFNEPYDPNYVSEFENEEGFELSRFNILLQLVDRNNLRYEYVLQMEVADRKDFREVLNKRLEPVGAKDLSDEDVMVGEFPVED